MDRGNERHEGEAHLKDLDDEDQVKAFRLDRFDDSAICIAERRMLGTLAI